MRTDEMKMILAELDTYFYSEEEKLEAIEKASAENSKVQVKYLKKAIKYLLERVRK